MYFLDTYAMIEYLKGTTEFVKIINTGEILTSDFQLMELYYYGLKDFDEDTAEKYAVIINSLWNAGTPIPTNDIWIAATAMQHGLNIVTTDPHYLKVPQVVANCFESYSFES